MIDTPVLESPFWITIREKPDKNELKRKNNK